eukprot:TRINITY_DN2308_c0_g1_i2.p1 TRINITY_DN2308_c0_g1~~TRINITY_DN2308_c0_g1_i2.p1  ORF type:complete len:194 (-),score=26.05 TRINITY_DN2308_c0_g1_i2:137-718(-)
MAKRVAIEDFSLNNLKRLRSDDAESPQTIHDFIPLEILVQIFKYLDDPSDIWAASTVCQAWRQLVFPSIELCPLAFELCRDPPRALRFVCDRCTSLRELGVREVPFWAGHINLIVEMKRLVDLQLLGSPIEPDVVTRLLTTLTHLNFLATDDLELSIGMDQRLRYEIEDEFVEYLWAPDEEELEWNTVVRFHC